MPMKTYKGSCHCGAVRFEADLDLSRGTNRCNCSTCGKARAWFAPAAPDDVRVTAKPGTETDYEWVPGGRSEANLTFRFCRICGVRTPGLGKHGFDGKPFWFVPIASLDDPDPDELAASIRYLDGRNDRYDRQPDDIRLM